MKNGDDVVDDEDDDAVSDRDTVYWGIMFLSTQFI
jgi:hypothetical protein